MTGGQYYVVTDPKVLAQDLPARSAARVSAGGQGPAGRAARDRVSARDPGGHRRTAAAAQGHGADDGQGESAGGSGHPLAGAERRRRTRPSSPPGRTAWAARRSSRPTPDIAGRPPGRSGRTTTSSTASWSGGRCGRRAIAASTPWPPTCAMAKCVSSSRRSTPTTSSATRSAMSGAAVGPDLQPFDFPIRQMAPGRYVGEFDASKAGSYHVTVVPVARRGAGPDRRERAVFGRVPRSRHQHRPAAATGRLAADRRRTGRAVAGRPGRVPDGAAPGAGHVPRRICPKAVSIRDVWPLLLLACGLLFLADVFVRRVAVTLDWVVPASAGCGPSCSAAASWRKSSSVWSDCGARSRKWHRASTSAAPPRDFRPSEEPAGLDHPPDVDAMLQGSAGGRRRRAAAATDPSAPPHLTRRTRTRTRHGCWKPRRRQREERDRKHKNRERRHWQSQWHPNASTPITCVYAEEHR